MKMRPIISHYCLRLTQSMRERFDLEEKYYFESLVKL